MYNLCVVYIGDFMKKPYIFITLFLITALFCSLISSIGTKVTESVNKDVVSQYTVVIDAGHDGKDVGTVGIDGTNEKDINLAIALRLYDYLMVSGYDALLIRKDDTEFYKKGEGRTRSDLYNRLDYVNSVQNGMLVSIHQNHFENESEWGTQIWYSANTEKSKALADSVLNSVKKNLQPSNKRTNKESDDSYYILYKATVPSIMIECGFMSNRDENNKLKNDKYQRDMAFSIMSGLSEEL